MGVGPDKGERAAPAVVPRCPQTCLIAAVERWGSVFFFQAEDGIRDPLVTGVQTCALPICLLHNTARKFLFTNSQVLCDVEKYLGAVMGRAHSPTTGCMGRLNRITNILAIALANLPYHRSEERRVGKECRSQRSTYPYKKTK